MYTLSPKDYKLLFQKTVENDFNITLLQIIKAKVSMWVCSGNPKDFSSKKLLCYKLTNSEIMNITKIASNLKNNNNNRNNYKIGSFLEVDPGNLVNLLKKLSGSAFE